MLSDFLRVWYTPRALKPLEQEEGKTAMAWIKTIPMDEADENLKRAMESQRSLYPIEYATPVHPTNNGAKGWDSSHVRKTTEIAFQAVCVSLGAGTNRDSMSA